MFRSLLKENREKKEKWKKQITRISPIHNIVLHTFPSCLQQGLMNKIAASNAFWNVQRTVHLSPALRSSFLIASLSVSEIPWNYKKNSFHPGYRKPATVSASFRADSYSNLYLSGIKEA